MHEIDISERLRILLMQTGKELSALKIAEEIALGMYGTEELEIRLSNAVRVSLSVVTEGVTVAPLQGISDVEIRTNSDNSKYLSISFAGPIRSAGGTETGLTVLIADHIRKVVGLDKYIANTYDDESGRYVEELRIYEREVGNFQFKVSDEDVTKCIKSLPVEINGVDTDPVEVVGHRNMRRISTNRVRGGALRVINDGLIGRSRKLMKLVETLHLDGWDWLDHLNGAIQTGNEDDVIQHRMNEVITGRPVLSTTKKIGGFRLRYGRSCNTGFATVGIHPSIPILLQNAVVVGTQIKMDFPGKASTIALVDSIEPPIVKLQDGTVLKVNTVQQAKLITSNVEKILYLGDILISYGDFLENNCKLFPSSYVEEIWTEDLKSRLHHKFDTQLTEFIENPFSIFPTPDQAFDISLNYNIPLHPRYVFYWETVTPKQVVYLLNEIAKYSNRTKSLVEPFQISNNIKSKKILEKLGISHSIKGDHLNIDDPDHLYILNRILNAYQNSSLRDSNTKQNNNDNLDNNLDNTLQFISSLLGVEINRKFLSSIAVRVGRPEKASERKMKPPVHVLFPVGLNGGITRDIVKASNSKSLFYTEIANRFCNYCNLPSIGNICRECSNSTPLNNVCNVCKVKQQNILTHQCPYCKNEYKTYSPVNFPLKKAIKKAQEHIKMKAIEPLKGVKMLMGKNRSAEPLEKGILRQKYELYTFKDGTIRFDATNEPLTHFKPKWIGTDIQKLRELGYETDYLGNELNSTDQLVELLIQDVIIPIHAGEHLLKVAKFIDDELTRFYKTKPFYNALSCEDLVGHLIVGLAPHTSVGIIGRLIGFVDSQVCLASPIWHSAKRRDCDGDADSMMLLTDLFLNFSYEYLPDKIGGLMDAPLLIQPIVYPHEVQRQALNIDISRRYPAEFYASALNGKKSIDVVENIETLRNRIGRINQFYDYYFTHPTNYIQSAPRSSYSTLNTMQEKLDMQIRIAKLIDAVDPNDVVSMVLTTHILPDIMGNIRAYSSQSFRCTQCGQKYRRIPLIGQCTECKNKLLQTVTRGSVEKYINIASEVLEQYNINEYLQSRVQSLKSELKLLFKPEQKQQFSMTDFI
jgi:DNA polymerase II large subunit